MEQGIEISNKPKKGDVLLYDGKSYKNVSLETLLFEVNKNIKDLGKQLLEREKEIKELKKEIKYLKGE